MSAEEWQRPLPPLTKDDLDRLEDGNQFCAPVGPIMLSRLISCARETVQRAEYDSEHDVVVQLLGNDGESDALGIALRLESERDDALKKLAELREDISKGLRIAHQVTDDTQTVEECCAELVRLVRKARSERDAASNFTIPSPPPFTEQEEETLP